MRTQEAGYYTDGHPRILPVKPVLRPDLTTINTDPDPGHDIMLVQEGPLFDKVRAIIYSVEELQAMGFTDLDKSYALESLEDGRATIIIERRSNERITLQVAADIGMALNKDDENAQEDEELDGVLARLGKYLDKLSTDLKAAYDKLVGEILPENTQTGPEVVKRALVAIESAMPDLERLGLGKVEITPQMVEHLLNQSLINKRLSAREEFDKPDNFQWEQCANAAFSEQDVLFRCDQDVLRRLIAAHTNTRVISFDDNPEHTVTLETTVSGMGSICPDLRIVMKHYTSGEEMGNRIKTRQDEEQRRADEQSQRSTQELARHRQKIRGIADPALNRPRT